MTPSGPPRFASVVLDVDSTLCGIEGIDWLAERRGEEIARRVASQTNRAMRGEVPLEEVYADRLATVRPRREDVDALGHAYIDTLAPGAAAAVASWRKRGVRVVLVSSAIRQALLPVAQHLGLGADEANGVDVQFDANGVYNGFDRSSPLATAVGKREIVAGLDLPRPILAVGDGSTDVAVRGTADAFAAFIGFVTRPAVTAQADFVAASFDELNAVVLGTD